MKLKKCIEHEYTLGEKCDKCGKETKDAHYKFIKMKGIRDVRKL